MGETSQRKIRTNLEASSKVETLSIFNAAQKFFRERTTRLNAACNQMNALLKQLQSRKLPQCVWSIRRDVGQGLHMQETFHCGCYGALVARGPNFGTYWSHYKYLSRPSWQMFGILQKALLLSNHSIYSVFHRYLGTWYLANDWFGWRSSVISCLAMIISSDW